MLDCLVLEILEVPDREHLEIGTHLGAFAMQNASAPATSDLLVVAIVLLGWAN